MGLEFEKTDQGSSKQDKFCSRSLSLRTQDLDRFLFRSFSETFFPVNQKLTPNTFKDPNCEAFGKYLYILNNINLKFVENKSKATAPPPPFPTVVLTQFCLNKYQIPLQKFPKLLEVSQLVGQFYSMCVMIKTVHKDSIVWRSIPHICHLLYTGRIFKFQILHLKITKIYPKKRKYVIFLRSIWKNLHLTEFFTRAAPVVPVTNMRYGYDETITTILINTVEIMTIEIIVRMASLQYKGKHFCGGSLVFPLFFCFRH